MTIPTERLEWHILTLEATPERARSIWQNEQLAFYKDLLTRRDAEAREGWVSVEERLPENFRRVPVYNGQIESAYCDNGVWFGCFGSIKPTHWLDTPAPC
jgi:hypothetical protein